jgi:NAD(P)-dependent dehydrogenase (short-subunit alcohol dehydrogenase family)
MFLFCTVFNPPPELQAETGYAKGELWLVDLADFDSIKRFADKFESDGGRSDILVENTAISTGTYNATKDGWETSFVHLFIYPITTELTPKLYSSLQVNDISTPLVALRLLPAMIRTAEKYSTLPRLVVVASEVHFFIEIEKEVYRNPDILKIPSSAEYSTPSYVPS